MRVKAVVFSTVIALGAVTGNLTTTAMSEPVGAADVAPVFDITQEPAPLAAYCFTPTRANISFYRSLCDDAAELAGYEHGVLRPRNQNDEGYPLASCPPDDGEGAGGGPGNQQYVCAGVAPR